MGYRFHLFNILNSSLITHNYCYAQSISSAELINNAKQYDGKAVVYEGEVIGDIMVRGDYAWLNVNDGQNAIGIWLDKNLTKDILYTGSYKFKGDWLEITGVFRRSCLQHGGDLDIHAQAIRKIRQGRKAVERLNMNKRNLAFVLLGVLCLAWILKQLRRK
ncbi:MAG: DNA-binding protein [Candidatus Omnitrophota bacterium]|nr:DNA-binding protein [Candidatus Omnitrophota bacterium]